MTAQELVNAYYTSWTNGAFDEPQLRSILAPDLVFEGPLAGHRVGADGFIRGVENVSKALKAFRLIQRLDNGNEVSVLYDCDLTRPPGTHRFAEFFRIENDRIQAINLLYDGTEWRKLTP
ncbi:MAG: nuclear transport factor 2 family protein [Chloroflexi bacterium]|nr:nuclear transport factor 2 family protein [Chloroflexota bacterium]